MSILTYNGIALPYGYTSSFRQEAVYDEMGNTDRILTKFDIQVSAVLNLQWIQFIVPTITAAQAANNAGLIMRAIRQNLMEPRRALAFNINGVDLIPNTTAGSGLVDSYNGPKPQSCDITQLNNVTFLINYHIIAHYVENNTVNTATLVATNLPGNVVLYNRWTETIEIDNCMMSRRTRNGKFMIRSDNNQGLIADMVRSQMAVVGVPTGFLRERSEYTQSADGLSIQYNVTDKEAYKLPPSPAFEADGEYSEEIVNGAIRRATQRIRLKGANKNISPQNKLIAVAIHIVAKKLQLGNAALAEHQRLTVGSFENWVEFSCTARMNNTKGVVYALAAGAIGGAANAIANGTGNVLSTLAGGAGGGFAGSIDKDGGSAAFLKNDGFSKFATMIPLVDDNVTRPAYLDRGSAGLLLQAAKYYDPALQGTQLGPGDVVADTNPLTGNLKSQLNNGVRIGQAGVILEP